MAKLKKRTSAKPDTNETRVIHLLSKMGLVVDREWNPKKIKVGTVVPETGNEFNTFREMDGVKNRVGLEIQFEKYAFTSLN